MQPGQQPSQGGGGGACGPPPPVAFQHQPTGGYGQPPHQQQHHHHQQLYGQQGHTGQVPMGGYAGTAPQQRTQPYQQPYQQPTQQQHPAQYQQQQQQPHAQQLYAQQHQAPSQPALQPTAQPPAAAPPPPPPPQEDAPPQVAQGQEQEAPAARAKKAFASFGKSLRKATDKVTHRGRVGDEEKQSEHGGEEDGKPAPKKEGGGVGGILGLRAGASGEKLAEAHRSQRAQDAPGVGNDGTAGGGGTGGIGQSVARYPTTKLRTWRTGYPRTLSLHCRHFVTLDPDTAEVTNRWAYSGLRQWMCLPKEEGCVLLEVTDGAPSESGGSAHGSESVHDGAGAVDTGGVGGGGSAGGGGGGTKLKFRCAARSDMLCRMLRQKYEKEALESVLGSAALTPPSPAHGPGGLPGAGMSTGSVAFPLFADCARHTRRGARVPCGLLAAPFGLVELSRGGPGGTARRALRTYAYTEITAISLVSDDPTGVVFHLGRRALPRPVAAVGGVSASVGPAAAAIVVTAKSRLFYVASSFRTAPRVGGGGGGGSSNHARSDLVAAVREYCDILGITLEVSESVRVQDWVERRRQLGSVAHVGEAIGSFRVVKKTERHNNADRDGTGHMERELVIARDGYLIERDSGSVAQSSWGSEAVAVGCRSLADIRCFVRHRSSGDSAAALALDNKAVTIEFMDGMSRTYASSDRDSLIVSLLDGCACLAGNTSVTVTDVGTMGYRLIMASPADVDRGGGNVVSEAGGSAPSQCLKRVHRIVAAAAAFLDASAVSSVDPAKVLDPVEECSTVVEACRELNANVPSCGSTLPDDRRAIAGTMGALWGMVERLLQFAAGDDSSSTSGSPNFDVSRRRSAVECVLLPLYQTIFRLCHTPQGFKNGLKDSPAALRSIQMALSTIQDDFAAYWSIMALGSLLTCPTSLGDWSSSTGKGEKKDKEAEFVNKSVILGADGVVEGLVERLLGKISSKGNEGEGESGKVSEMILAAVGTILESVLCSNHDTTVPEQFSAFLKALSTGHRALMSMLRSSTPLITENTALLLHLLTTHSPSTSRLIREDALSSGVVLHHFHAAIYSPLEGQRFLSRYLCGLWFRGDKNCREKRLLRRVVPPGFLEYLNVPILSQVEEDQLDELERGGIEDEESTARGTLGAEEGTITATNTRRLRSRIGIAAATSSDFAAPGSQPAKPENFRIFFHVLTKDHSLPDLIWNQTTRRELRIALESELLSIKRAAEAKGGPDKIAWNYFQFCVSYPSLREEVRVGRVYMRLWLQAGDGFIRSWDDPAGLFEVLFRRLLCDLDRDVMVTNMCIRCLNRLYAIHWSKIGPFSDIMILVRSMSTTRTVETQHRLLALIATLLGVSEDIEKYGEVNVPDNAEQLLNGECIGQLCQFVAWGHTDISTIKNLLTGAVSSGRRIGMLTDGTDTKPGSGNGGTTGAQSASKGNVSAQDDKSSPAVWFVAPAGRIPPPSKDITGPFRVSDLVRHMEHGELHPHSLVTTAHVEEYGGDGPEEGAQKCEAQIDTGNWRTLEAVWQLRWQLCTDGASGNQGPYGPSEVALVALRSLSRLVELHDSVDSRGLPYFPVPIAKRLLCGLARNSSAPSPDEGGSGLLSHVTDGAELDAGTNSRDYLAIIAQSLLSPDPRVVEAAASLLDLLMEHNDAASAKLYLTGAFFFALQYTGSNVRSIARLLHRTHLRQHFRSGFAAAAKESDLPAKERSVLGNMLPQGVLLILMNYGFERFADVLVGDFDTPEVIWSLEMRKHLVEMIRQHLGNFPQRLGQQTTAAYEYCPMPGVAYQRLEGEMFCHNYYLRNLVDEDRFPDWPIAEPVEVFRACLEEWKRQMNRDKVKEEDAQEEARKVLGLKAGDGGVELRKAYRGLARKFHPDKNPAGREKFEKIQTSYELLLPVVEGGGKITTSSAGVTSDGVGCSSDAEASADDVAKGLSGGQRQMNAVHLLMKAQLLVCRRYPKDIGKYKYPAYKMLLSCLSSPFENLESEAASGEDAYGGLSFLLEPARAKFVRTGVDLVFQSCLVSPLNAEELIREGGMHSLESLLDFYINALLRCSRAEKPEHKQLSTSLVTAIVMNLVHTIAGVAYFENGRNSILGLGDPSRLFMNWRRCIDNTLQHNGDRQSTEDSNLLKRYAFEGVASMARSGELQSFVVGSGIVWPLLRHLLCFDPTLEGVSTAADRADVSSGAQCQADSNDNARLAARALGMLCGVMKDKLETPLNADLYDAMKVLLTEPIARMLRNARSIELLRTLNDGADVETPNRVWNSNMRKELLAFLDEMEKDRDKLGHRSVDEELEHTKSSFQYTNLKDEVVIGGIYVRIFIGLGGGRESVRDIPDCSNFCRELLRFISVCLAESPDVLRDEDKSFLSGATSVNRDLQSIPVSDQRFVMGVQSLRLLVRVDGLVDDVICDRGNPAVVLSLLELPQDCAAFDEGSDILALMSSKQLFANAIAAQQELWRLLRILERAEVTGAAVTMSRTEDELIDSAREKAETNRDEQTSSINNLKRQQRGWSILESLTCSPSVATVLIQSSGWLELLGIVVGYTNFTKTWAARVGAAKTLARLLWDPNTGPLAAPLLQKFLPPGLLVLLKDDGPDTMLRVFDKESETPELIWDADMRGELRTAVNEELDACLASDGPRSSKEFSLPPSFCVRYKKLAVELYIGGVYVRLFLKEPRFVLRDSVAFLEMLLVRWSKDLEGLICHEKPSDEISEIPSTTTLSTAQQDTLELVTSASVFLCKIHSSLCDRLSEWGYLARSVLFIHQTAAIGLVGTPMICAVRLIHVAASRRANVEALALVGSAGGREGTVEGIMKAVGGDPLHSDSSFFVEALKMIFQDALGDVKNSSSSKLPTDPNGLSDKPAPREVSAAAPQYSSATLPGKDSSMQSETTAQMQETVRLQSNIARAPVPYAMAPSPAPGPDPVNPQRGMMKSKGDDPLSFLLNDSNSNVQQTAPVSVQQQNQGQQGAAAGHPSLSSQHQMLPPRTMPQLGQQIGTQPLVPHSRPQNHMQYAPQPFHAAQNLQYQRQAASAMDQPQVNLQQPSHPSNIASRREHSQQSRLSYQERSAMQQAQQHSSTSYQPQNQITGNVIQPSPLHPSTLTSSQYSQPPDVAQQLRPTYATGQQQYQYQQGAPLSAGQGGQNAAQAQQHHLTQYPGLQTQRAPQLPSHHQPVVPVGLGQQQPAAVLQPMNHQNNTLNVPQQGQPQYQNQQQSPLQEPPAAFLSRSTLQQQQQPTALPPQQQSAMARHSSIARQHQYAASQQPSSFAAAQNQQPEQMNPPYSAVQPTMPLKEQTSQEGQAFESNGLSASYVTQEQKEPAAATPAVMPGTMPLSTTLPAKSESVVGAANQAFHEHSGQREPISGGQQPHTLPLGPESIPQPETPDVIEGAGVDARSSANPTIVAEQKTVSVSGAPGCAQGRTALLYSAIELNLPRFLVEEVLENPTLSDVKDPAGTKVHSIELLKLLTMDPAFGMKISLILDAIPNWSKYKAQDHSLFVTGGEQKVDYFLTNSGEGEKKLLTSE